MYSSLMSNGGFKALNSCVDRARLVDLRLCVEGPQIEVIFPPHLTCKRLEVNCMGVELQLNGNWH